MANRDSAEYGLLQQRQNLAETLKTPPSTGKSAVSRKVNSAIGFASNPSGIPKRPHSGMNPRQARDNSNGPAPNAKQMRTKIDQLESMLFVLQKTQVTDSTNLQTLMKSTKKHNASLKD